MGDEESIAEFDMDGVQRDGEEEEADLSGIDFSKLTPLSPEVICRQATINIGTIGHVAHGKSTVVKAISGVKTVRYKNELERNITIKLGYANAKIFKCKVSILQKSTFFPSFLIPFFFLLESKLQTSWLLPFSWE